ncbi:MAG: hypothetical protein WDZ60_10345, partial [Wenzhouxiangellaceae bacterium]
EGPAVIDESARQATTPMPTRDGGSGKTAEKTADPAPAPTLALEPEDEPEPGRGRGLALAAVIVLLLAGGAIAGSWYLLSAPERPLLAMFGPALDEIDENAVVEPVADGPVVADESSSPGAAADRAAEQTEVPDSPADNGDAGSESSIAQSLAEADGPGRDVAVPSEITVAETGIDADVRLDEALARVGESSGEPLVSVAMPGASTRLAGDQAAMPANPPVAVVAVGDAAVAGSVAWEIKRALNGASFEIIDEQLIDGLVYAESLAGVVRTVRDAGASVLVYADVVPAGARELQFYGRLENQYLASLEVRVVDLHAQRNLGPVMAEKLEYVALTADRKAREAAGPVARKVVNRLRALRSRSGQDY